MFIWFKKKITGFQYSKRQQQVILLLGANLLILPLAAISSIFCTKLLGTDSFGDYSFLLSIYNFGIVVFSFGFFQASNRAILLEDDQQAISEYYGATLFNTLILFGLMSVCFISWGIFDHNLESKGIQTFFLFTIPCGFVFLLAKYFDVLLQADNRITLLALVRLLPKALFLLYCIIFFIFKRRDTNLAIIWWGNISLQFITYAIIFFFLYPSFRHMKKRMHQILEFNKSYGIHLYIGSIFSVGASSLSGILISYFSKDNSAVGFFSLALAFASPLVLIPNTIATTHYKQFATQAFISRKLTIWTLGLTSLGGAGILLFVPLLISFFYGEEFKSVIPLNVILCIGFLFYGISDYINRFLCAHGKGKELRNASFIVAFFLLLADFILIPIFGASGAAWALFISGTAYLFTISMYYRHFRSLEH